MQLHFTPVNSTFFSISYFSAIKILWVCVLFYKKDMLKYQLFSLYFYNMHALTSYIVSHLPFLEYTSLLSYLSFHYVILYVVVNE